MLPDCPHCDASQTLSITLSDMGTHGCVCSYCGKTCTVDDSGRLRKFEPSKTDIQGRVMDAD